MEKLNELLSNVNERLRSPVLFSFLISWLIVNWEIPISLFYYESGGIAGLPDDLIVGLLGYSTGWSLFYLPLLLAMAYTFGMPILRNIITAFYAWAERWGGAWEISISKESKVSMTKYLSLREQHKKRTELLEEVIESESGTLEKLDETEAALASARDETNRYKEEIASMRGLRDNLSNTGIIRGQWERRIDQEVMNLEFNDSTVYARVGTRREQKFQINSFMYNAENKVVRFMLMTPTGDFHSFEDLELRNKDLVGWEYKSGSRREVIYTRYGY